MPYVLGFGAIAFLILLLVAGVRGRVRVSSCCSMSSADPRQDLRMAAAFADPATGAAERTSGSDRV